TTEPMPNVNRSWLGRRSPTLRFGEALLITVFLLPGGVLTDWCRERGVVVHPAVVQDQAGGRLDLAEPVQAGGVVPPAQGGPIEQAHRHPVLLLIVGQHAATCRFLGFG